MIMNIRPLKRLFLVVAAFCLTVLSACTNSMWALSSLFTWLNVANVYDLKNLYVPIQSIYAFYDYPFDISIFWYIIFICAYRLIILLAMAYIVFGISAFTNYVKSIMISVLFIAPHLIYRLKLEKMFYFSIVPAFDFTLCWNMYGLKRYMYYMPVFLIMFAIVMFIKCYRKIA